MTKRFNWNYNTAHQLGTSHARDVDTSHWATFTGHPDPLDAPIRHKRPSELAHSEELAQHDDPMLLGNRYA